MSRLWVKSCIFARIICTSTKNMKQLLLFIAIFLPVVGLAKIDRRQVLTRNNPHVNAIDSLASLSVGNGHFAFTVDATGLITAVSTGTARITIKAQGEDDYYRTEIFSENTTTVRLLKISSEDTSTH